MDPSISWFQPEQEGPAKVLWLRLWQTQLEFDHLNVKDGDNDMESINNTLNTQNPNAGLINGKMEKGTTSMYGPRRRKLENRASTRGLNRHPDKFIGEFGGCPWRKENFTYGQGVIGLV